MTKTPLSITFEPNEYKYPSWLPAASAPADKPRVEIEFADIQYAALHGSTWQQLEALYLVDMETLKLYFTAVYSQAQAQLQINVMHTMVNSAVTAGDTVMLKWLSSNLLGMSDKVTQTPQQPPVDEAAINAKLNALLMKHSEEQWSKDSSTVDNSTPIQH